MGAAVVPQPEGKDRVDFWPNLESWWAEVTVV